MKTITNNTRMNLCKMGAILLVTISGFMQSCGPNPIIDPEDPEPQSIDFDYLTAHSDALVEISDLHYYDDESSNLTLKFYDVQNSTDDTRPLVILNPGGGYTRYTHEDKLSIYAMDLAKRGYAVALIKYSIASTPDAEVWVKAVLDEKTVIRFFKKNAEEYKIDVNNIFTGGWSTGAQLSMWASHMDAGDYETLEPTLKNAIDSEVNSQGFTPSIYEEYDDNVRGTILMMPYTNDLNIFDTDGPAIMLVGHESQHFLDGTILMGELTYNTIKHYGPDKMKEAIEAAGYIDGENFDYTLFTNDGTAFSEINQSILTRVDMEDVVDFIHRNLVQE